MNNYAMSYNFGAEKFGDK